LSSDQRQDGGTPPDAAGPRGHGRHRTFPLTNVAVRNPTITLVLLVVIATLGLVAYTTIPKEASPEVTIPVIAVSTIYAGVAPNDVESQVTRVLEEKLNTIPQIRELTSTSVEGYSSVVAEFSSDMNMDAALQKVREKVDLARPELPADAEEPSIFEFNLSEFPILQVNISGAYDLVRLRAVAERIQERLEQIPALLEVRSSGGLEREVRVEVDLVRLKNYGIAFGDVIDAIRNENVTIPGGGIDVGSQEFLVRVAGEFEDPRLIEDVVVLTRGDRPVYIRDLATVDFGFKDRESYARLDGRPVITLDVVKRSGENIIATAQAVRQAIDELAPELPATTVVKVTSDQSKYIRAMVANLENSIIFGLILVIGVLFFFLGVRNSTFVGISIPMSMLLSFAVMKVLGFSMNMVVLFSLILALGMLVDNAIVVVENIYRHLEEGMDRITAATWATGEVAMPIITSTATTVGAFLPLMFWPGIVGEFMGWLPKTLIITLSSSLFVALVIVPTLCALFMRLDGDRPRPLTPAARWTGLVLAGVALLAVGARNPLTAAVFIVLGAIVLVLHRRVMDGLGKRFQARVLPIIIEDYGRRLRWALRHRAIVVGGAVGVFIATVLVFGRFNVGTEFFPERIPPATVYVSADVPSGTNVAFTNRVAERLEAQLAELPGMSDAESVVATVGGSGNMWFGNQGDATIAVSFREYQDREHDTFETLRAMQQRLGEGIAGADVTAKAEEMGPPSGKPVNLEIIGTDADVLKRLADQAVAVLKDAPVYRKLEGLGSDMSDARPELLVDVDRERAALYGLNTSKIGGTIRSAIQGTAAAKYRTGSDEYDIVVRLAQPWRDDLSSLQNLEVIAEDGSQIPLASVASWRVQEGYGSIRRKDLDRVATVSADVRGGYNSNAVLAEVEATLAGFERALPPGYGMRFTGMQEDQQESQQFLMNAFLAALLFIGFILIAQFNSVIKPFIIMTAVVMSTVGVLLGLLVFRMPFGIIMTGVGVISLAGVVVNNAIVLIDYIDLLRERDGLDRREALIRAGMTRFRPVILTAVTTVLGLVPLAIGLNFDFLGFFSSLNPELYWGGEQAAWWGPMAIAVIAGLAFATFLTLVLVPVLYAIVDDIGVFFRRHYTWGGGEPALAGDGPAEPGRRAREPVAAGGIGRVWSRVRAVF
jgi:multidrug efflux pump